MEQVYRNVARDVYAKYVESGLVKPEREQAVVDECVKHLAMLNVKVKFVANEKKDAPTKTSLVCAYQMVKNGVPTKPCGKTVKNPVSLYCDRHYSNESCETPGKYLRIRFPNFASKCVDVTRAVRDTKGVNLHLNSTASVYNMYVIRNITPDYHAVYYAEHNKQLGWKHVLLGCLSIKKDCAFEMNTDAMTGISIANHIPQCDAATGARVRPGLKSLNRVFGDHLVKSEDK